MNYYQRHIGDYAKKAGHLSALEHGVYTLLLDAYYDREQGPTKAEAIRWTRARSADEVAAVETVLAEFFTLKGGRYLQSRVEDEFKKWAEYQQKQSDKGKKGGRPRKAEVNPEESCGFSEESRTKAEKSLIHSSTNPLLQQEAKALSGKPLGFGDFWKAYPNKKGKIAAEKVWKRRKLDALTPEIIADVQARIKADPDWLRGFVPHGSTYVSEERWHDALKPDALPAAAPPVAGNSPAKPETAESKAAAHAAATAYAAQFGYTP